MPLQTVWTQIGIDKIFIGSGAKLLDTHMVFLKDFFETINFEEDKMLKTKKKISFQK